MRVFASFMSMADLLEEYPQGIPAEKFVAVKHEKMPSGFWQTFAEAVSPDEKVLFFDQEVIILVQGEKATDGFYHDFKICLAEGLARVFLTPVGEIGQGDMKFTFDCPFIDIRRKIYEKVREAYIKLEEKRKEIEGLMKTLDFTSGFVIGTWSLEDEE